MDRGTGQPVARLADVIRLWGTAWPHLDLEANTPDDGVLVDVLPRLARTTGLQQAFSIDNPSWLYWR